MKLILKLFIFLITFSALLKGDFETLGGDDVDINDLDQQILFVSLGSYCAPASLQRSCGLRKAAFPFDWNITMDGEKLIEMLQDGFANFLHEKYFVSFGSSTLLNTYYHIEFVHDGNWCNENDYAIYMPILQSKYQRRIERFKKLNSFLGKVYFMRAAYIYSTEDINRYYKNPENIEISEEYAAKLYEALKELFPDLDFSLLIINNHEHEYVIEEKRLHEGLIMVRAPALNEPVMISAYNVFFKELIQNSIP